MKTIRREKMIRHYGGDIWIGKIGCGKKNKKNTDARPKNIAAELKCMVFASCPLRRN